MISELDAFLAHNSKDKPQVRLIANKLRQYDLHVWLDEEQIIPGQIFQVEIQKAIQKVSSAVIFIGHEGLGRWQTHELPALYSQFVQAENITTVIPVLLPGVNEIPKDLLFLAQHHWVSFSEGIDDVKALESLVWGITGLKPQETVKVIPQTDDDLGTPKPPTKTKEIWLLGDIKIEDDLSSDRNVDYTPLRDLLAAGNWKDADYETYLVILKVVGLSENAWITDKELLNFPCTDLRTIDNLWVKYSNGRFGFSVQKKIYLEVGGKPDDKMKYEEAWKKFGDRVGWRKGWWWWIISGGWIEYPWFTFNTSAPDGHLPCRVWCYARHEQPPMSGFSRAVISPYYYGYISSLASRFAKCNL